MITHSKLSNMKSEILPNCLKGKYGYSLGEFNNTSNVVFVLRGLKKRSSTVITNRAQGFPNEVVTVTGCALPWSLFLRSMLSDTEGT